MTSSTLDVLYHRGTSIRVRGIQVHGKALVVQGRLVSVARLKDEWYDELNNPEATLQALRNCSPKPDILTFWQRLPDITPVYPYHFEYEALSAIPLRDYRHWWENQIKSDTRKKARRSEKRGIRITLVTLNDEFVTGVSDIFNDTPVRRGKPFWHYGKDLETVKEELSRNIENSQFVGAYEDGRLVGFVKLVFAEGRFANPALILSTLQARAKYVNNALIAKAVEVCAEKHVPYLTYTVWRKGAQAAFLARHGFERTLVPRYWIPLTKKGAIAMRLGLHHGIRGYIPAWLMSTLLRSRRAFYSRKYGSKKDGDLEA